MRKYKDTKQDFWNSNKINDSTYLYYYTTLTELAISMFEWKNLPETVDARFLELTLFSDGMAVFFKDKELGYLALQTMIGTPLNVYRIPTKRRAYAVNGYRENLTEEDSVIIYNNYLHTNSMCDIEMFASRLYDITRTIDVNVNAQKTPIMISCDEDQRLTLLHRLWEVLQWE